MLATSMHLLFQDFVYLNFLFQFVPQSELTNDSWESEWVILNS